MPSTFFGLGIGTSGLYTYQAALNVTAHNVSNAQTDGYTRQVLNQRADTPISVYSSYGMVGTGVVADSITQQRNEYYDVKYRSNAAIYGVYSTKENYMEQIVNYFNELKGNGLLANIQNFSDSLQELTKNTSSNAVRAQIAQYGDSIADFIKKTADDLSSLQKDANDEIKISCQRINALSEQISILTKQINTIEIRGQIANDLRDSRNLLIDELSQYANITVTERKVSTVESDKGKDGSNSSSNNEQSNSSGRTTFVVKLNGHTIVDSTEYNALELVPREYKNHVNDINGLYDVMCNDQKVDLSNPTLGGKLQALCELRDGNNNVNFNGKVTGITGNVAVVQNSNVNDELLLNIPASGTIVIDNKRIEYSSFEMEVGADGAYTYKFHLVDPQNTDQLVGMQARIGDTIDYKGIPYYMSQLNEYVRTLSQQMNDIHRTGVNSKGETGLNFFTGTNKMDNSQYALHGKNDVITVSNSYYNLTASNFSINSKILDDPMTIATTANPGAGVENKEVLTAMIECMKDKSMFREGSPYSFIQALISDIGVDADKANSFATSQTNILKAIENQRLSVSGVDEDEEAMNLVRFQNAYNLSAKVISIMDEVYDKLINYMGA